MEAGIGAMTELGTESVEEDRHDISRFIQTKCSNTHPTVYLDIGENY
jgi:uncharacterized Zn-finger protein